MGMVVQLAALAVFNRLCAGPLSVCDGRGDRVGAAAQLCVAPALHVARPAGRLRAAGNWCGSIFRMGWCRMLGNLALMRVLVQEARMPVWLRTALRFCAARWPTSAWETAGRSRPGRRLVRTRSYWTVFTGHLHWTITQPGSGSNFAIALRCRWWSCRDLFKQDAILVDHEGHDAGVAVLGGIGDEGKSAGIFPLTTYCFAPPGAFAVWPFSMRK